MTRSAAVGPLRPVGRTAEVSLRLSRYSSQRRDGSDEIVSVVDEYRPPMGWTSCLLPGHFPGKTPTRLVAVHGYHLDCACDVDCPRCTAPVGTGCRTLGRGGTSDGGYATSLHASRIKVSPRCQALLEHAITRCDLGDHDWRPVARGASPSADGPGHARCVACGRVEPLRAQAQPYAARSHSHWLRMLPR